MPKRDELAFVTNLSSSASERLSLRTKFGLPSAKDSGFMEKFLGPCNSYVQTSLLCLVGPA
jgi:hypothetical protein